MNNQTQKQGLNSGSQQDETRLSKQKFNKQDEAILFGDNADGADGADGGK